MRSMLAATLVLLVCAVSARAQMTPPTTAGAKPKAVATVPIRPALQTPADTANAMAQAERLALQSDLAWVGEYNGAISGEVSERMVAAIKEYQKAKGGKQTGVLNPQERSVLAETARRRQENVGWKIVTDATTGTRLGIPTKLVPQQTSDANGAEWSTPTGTVQIVLTRRKEAGPTTAKLAEQEKKEPPGRAVDYTVVKPDFFVLSGLQGLKKFYLRGTFKGDEVRILTILYDQATENTVEPIVIAMSSAFNPFPTRGRGQGPRSRLAAHLWRARIEAACLGRRRGQIRRRHHRDRRSAKPGRRRGGHERQGIGDAGRGWRRPRALAAAGRGLLRRRGT